jgi:hypothetical protein
MELRSHSPLLRGQNNEVHTSKDNYYGGIAMEPLEICFPHCQIGSGESGLLSA